MESEEQEVFVLDYQLLEAAFPAAVTAFSSTNLRLRLHLRLLLSLISDKILFSARFQKERNFGQANANDNGAGTGRSSNFLLS